jgi:hypothetical protein
MGGDEFVVIAPGLTPEAAVRKAEQMRDLAQQAGKGHLQRRHPVAERGQGGIRKTGWMRKRSSRRPTSACTSRSGVSPSPKNRRLYPRVRGRLTTEISGVSLQQAQLGIVTNLSLGGCYIETSGLLLPGVAAETYLSHEHTNVLLEAKWCVWTWELARPSSSRKPTHEVRAALQRILDQLASHGSGGGSKTQPNRRRQARVVRTLLCAALDFDCRCQTRVSTMRYLPARNFQLNGTGIPVSGGISICGISIAVISNGRI